MMLEWLMELAGDEEMKVKVNQELKGWLMLLFSLGDITNNQLQHFMHLKKGKKRVNGECIFCRVQLLGELIKLPIFLLAEQVCQFATIIVRKLDIT